MAPSFRDHYKVLGVDPSDDSARIKAAHRSLARKYHPDSNPDAGAAIFMRIINTAKDALLDPVKRAEFDRQRAKALGLPIDPVAEIKSIIVGQGASVIIRNRARNNIVFGIQFHVSFTIEDYKDRQGHIRLYISDENNNFVENRDAGAYRDDLNRIYTEADFITPYDRVEGNFRLFLPYTIFPVIRATYKAVAVLYDDNMKFIVLLSSSEFVIDREDYTD